MLKRRQLIQAAGTVVLPASGLSNNTAWALTSIRYFITRQKVYNIHFRNIRGKRNSFQEVYSDKGDLDMFNIICNLKQVHYSGMLMPDHVPQHPHDRGQRQGFAFAFGYIKGLIQAVYAKP
jgi:mannonate dehydratase